MRRLLNDRTHYATAVGCTHDGQPQRVGRVWIKPHIGRHDEQGAYENLVEELRHDPAEFEKFHRVNPATFDFLLAKVDGVISRQNIQSFNIGSREAIN